ERRRRVLDLAGRERSGGPPRERRQDVVGISRLVQVIGGAEPDGLDRGRDAPVSRENDDLDAVVERSERTYQLEAGPVRHPQIDARTSRPEAGGDLLRVGEPTRGLDLVAAVAERAREAVAQHAVV